MLKPYGVWVVIAPFNFPLALAGGPTAAALVTGNTVVLKGATATPWAGRLLADCIRDAGLPPGVFNYLSGHGEEVGGTLISHPLTAGATFTGSHEVGMRIAQALQAPPGAASLHCRDGGQECLHRHGGGGPRARRERYRALRLRHGRAEVLGALAAVCAPGDRRAAAREAAAADRRDPHRRPDPSRALARPRDDALRL